MCKILMVDDDQAILRAYERTLTVKGHVVDAAPDGRTAIGLLSRGKYDVILSDLGMPEMSGIEFVRTVRAHDLDVPVVLLTGVPSVETATAALDYGAFAYLTKPVDPSKLDSTIARAVQMHGIARLKRAGLEMHGDEAKLLGDRASLESRFDLALDRLWMAFQPIIAWNERKTFGYEALLRCTEPTLGNPALVFDAAERLGRLWQLGRRVRGMIAAEASALPADVLLFVNLHPADLEDDQLLDPTAPLSAIASRVVLEITERASLDAVAGIRARISGLRALGFRIAVDDLGAGYAGLSTLTQLEPDIVKLDMSLVRGIHEQPTKMRVVRSMLSLCREMSVSTVMEGVETAAERDTLTALGAELLQGYLFAKPARGFSAPVF